jgi:stringent starvation protein B
MAEVSTKPYLIRAIYDWCTDAGFTPYIAVAVDDSVRVPAEFVNNGEIVLNVSALATSRLLIDNDAISFQARFGGVPRDVYVPMARVIAVYARENGQGMAFEVPRALSTPSPVAALPTTGAMVPVAAPPSSPELPEPPGPPKPAADRPKLTRIK